MFSPETLKSDFRAFLKMVWDFLGLPDPTAVQYDIANFLQEPGTRKVIEAFRGIGKSWITVAYVLWVLYKDPQKKILVVSASKPLADEFSTFAMRLLEEIPELAHLKPSDSQRQSKIAWDVGPALPAKAPSVKSVGITGQITGSRADLIIPDDIEVPNNSATQLEREQLASRIEEFESVLTPKDDSSIVYLGTPQCEQSVYNLLPGRGFTVRVWPARFPNETQRPTYGDRLAPSVCRALDSKPHLAGCPVEPKRFPEEVLLSKEQGMGRSTFALQFMLDTSLGDANRYPLKISDLIIMDLHPKEAPRKVSWASGYDQMINDPTLPNLALDGDRYHRPLFVSTEEPVPYQAGVLAIDPSGRGGDELGYAVIKYLHGLLYVSDWGGIQGVGYSDEVLTKLAEIARDQGVTNVHIESNFGDGMFTKLFQPILQKYHQCSIEEVRHNSQKEKRIIDTLEPVLNQHRLILDKKLIRKDYDTALATQHGFEVARTYSGIYQMTRITRDKGCLLHDDRLDALAIGVAFWIDQMNRDIDRLVQKTQEAEVQKLIKETLLHQVQLFPKETRRSTLVGVRGRLR